MQLYTSHFGNRDLKERPDLACVRISRWPPRFDPGFPIIGSCSQLWPSADMLARCKAGTLDALNYAIEYGRILSGHGVPAIRARLKELHELGGRRPLVLLCFEDLTKPDLWCHRRIFAHWWKEQTGRNVHELEPAPARPAVPELVQPTLF